MSDQMPKSVAPRFLLEAMSNLTVKDTGVEGAVIWVSAGEFYGADPQRGPRLKVMLGEKLSPDGLRDAASVTLTKPPRVLGRLPSKVRGQVVSFVNMNRDVLLRAWNGEIDTSEMLDLLESV